MNVTLASRSRSPEACTSRARRRSHGATVRVTSVSSSRTSRSRSRSRPRMIIVHRTDRSSSAETNVDDLLGGTIEDREESPDSSLQGDETEPMHLPEPFAPPSLSKPAGGRPMNPKWGRLPEVPRMKQTSRVDEQDKNTPDHWVPRDPDLVRLTGKHPFNCEAKLDRLYAAGFLTPSSLFYVRNHGAVPRVDAEQAANWKLRIHGMVEKELNLSIAELQEKMETVTIPVTLVCAGNRRKEQNMVRKGLGFNWGAAGVSNALFTGVYICDLLKLVKPKKGSKFVIYEGADKLPNGPYGTSQPLAWSKDRLRGHMIAWAMNGLPLEPDHGFPLRLIVPGQIGGRMVKWLNRIEISHQESQHYLHFRDNKVLPMQLLPDQARAEEDWWMDPRYTIYDLNVQSAIAQPNHDEELDVSTVKGDEETYAIKGYAYSGAGQRITRVEISVDDGETWLLSHITYPEDLYREVTARDPVYGTLDLSESISCYSWCFWAFDCPISKLKTTSVILARAMDASMNMQPRDMYWNSTSMLNNWYFRVAVHRITDDKGTDKLHFEHPTMAGVVGGGWMSRMQEAGLDIFKPIFSSPGQGDASIAKSKPKPKVETLTKAGIDRIITKAELAEHANEHEPWFVVNGQVYEGTDFLEKHPGGGESITLVAGEDASEDFMAIHSSDAKRQLRDFHIGKLEGDDVSGNAPPEAEGKPDDPTQPFLVKNRWKPAKLVKITPVSHDSRIFRFELQHPDQPLGLPIGAHAYTRLKRKILKQRAGGQEGETELVEGDSWTQRAYTPVSLPNAKGFIDLLIKIYFPVDSFEGGKMTVGFNELNLGDIIEFKGPIGHFNWLKPGLALWKNVERRVKKLGMICGGSGVTPILQVLRGVFMNPDDRETEVWLLDSNKEEADILCKDDLECYLDECKDRYRLHYALSRPPPDWKGTKGRLNEKTMREHLPPPADDTLILICGPDSMIEQTVKPALTNLGYDVPNQLVIF